MDRKEHTFFSKWRKEQFFWVKTRIICLSENESEKEKNLCPGENWNYLSEWKLKIFVWMKILFVRVKTENICLSETKMICLREKKLFIYLREKNYLSKNWNYLSEWKQKLFVRVKTIELLGRNWLPSGAPGSPHGCCLPPFVTLFAQIQK